MLLHEDLFDNHHSKLAHFLTEFAHPTEILAKVHFWFSMKDIGVSRNTSIYPILVFHAERSLIRVCPVYIFRTSVKLTAEVGYGYLSLPLLWLSWFLTYILKQEDMPLEEMSGFNVWPCVSFIYPSGCFTSFSIFHRHSGDPDVGVRQPASGRVDIHDHTQVAGKPFTYGRKWSPKKLALNSQRPH